MSSRFIHPNNRSEDLIQRAIQGEGEAIAALYKLYESRLSGVVRHKLDQRFFGPMDSHDLIQSVWMEILDDISSFEYRGPDSFFKCLLNRMIYKIQAKQRYYTAGKRDVNREVRMPSEKTPLSQDLTPSQHAMSNERVEKVMGVLNRFPLLQRRVLILRIRDELGFEQIGEKIGKSPEAARKLFSRAQKRLVTCLLNPDMGSI